LNLAQSEYALGAREELKTTQATNGLTLAREIWQCKGEEVFYIIAYYYKK
jgi:hypothetical protein